MSQSSTWMSAEVLRADFDRAFTVPARDATLAPDSFLAVHIGGDPYALRLDAIAGLQADRKVAPIPSDTPALLGIVAVRGVLAPVYDLRALLGYPGGPSLRWLLFAKAAEPIGLAFDHFDAHLRIDPSLVTAPAASEHARAHVRGRVQTPQGALPLIDLASILDSIHAARARL